MTLEALIVTVFVIYVLGLTTLAAVVIVGLIRLLVRYLRGR